MEINEINKKLYEDAFISNEEYGDLNDWKPSIDERTIEEMCEYEDGKWGPAIPLGYRDYKLSREEGLRNIIYHDDFAKAFTKKEVNNIKKDDNVLKQYDKIIIDEKPYVVAGDDESNFYVADEENHMFYIAYSK